METYLKASGTKWRSEVSLAFCDPSLVCLVEYSIDLFQVFFGRYQCKETIRLPRGVLADSHCA